MKKYSVSVCVPVYNAEKYLKECLDSLVNQTLKSIQIVCVNDGSTDSSLDILNEYAAKYDNLVIVTQKNQGLGGARNTGIKNAHGEYIGFLDADDIADLTMFEKMYLKAKSENAEMVMCNVELYPKSVNTSKSIWYKPYTGKITGEFLNKNTQPWNKIVLRDVIDRTNFQFFEKNGDGVFIILMLNCNKIVSIDEKLHNYRVGHSSMSTNYKLDNFVISVESAKKQQELLKTTKYAEELKDYFDYRMIYVLIQAIAIAALRNDKGIYKMYCKELKKYNFRKNKYMKTILKKEFSSFKYFGMVYVLPLNYTLSRVLTKIIL